MNFRWSIIKKLAWCRMQSMNAKCLAPSNNNSRQPTVPRMSVVNPPLCRMCGIVGHRTRQCPNLSDPESVVELESQTGDSFQEVEHLQRQEEPRQAARKEPPTSMEVDRPAKGTRSRSRSPGSSHPGRRDSQVELYAHRAEGEDIDNKEVEQNQQRLAPFRRGRSRSAHCGDRGDPRAHHAGVADGLQAPGEGGGEGQEEDGDGGTHRVGVAISVAEQCVERRFGMQHS